MSDSVYQYWQKGVETVISNAKSEVVVSNEEFKQKGLSFASKIREQLHDSIILINNLWETNFIYKISGKSFSGSEIQRINSITDQPKIKSRLRAIIEAGAEISFERVAHPVFQNNMILIDSALPEMMAAFLLEYYRTGVSNLSDVLSTIEQRNPLNYSDGFGHKFYQYKIKKFLTDIALALGLMATKVWNGKYDATGGYLVVKKDGEVLCYHIYNQNEFEDYLLSNTKFETASLSRHQFGEIYREGNDYFFKLNLQIRFIK